MYRKKTYQIEVGGPHSTVPMDEDELQTLLWFVMRTTYQIESLDVEAVDE